nr:hypothetical protein [Mycoplasmopsis bovis]
MTYLMQMTNLWEDFLNKEDIHTSELWEQIDIDLKIMDGSKYLSQTTYYQCIKMLNE